jgi:hypothetical protein
MSSVPVVGNRPAAADSVSAFSPGPSRFGIRNEPRNRSAASAAALSAALVRSASCAVLAAAGEGRVDTDRLASYRKLRAEAAYIERKTDHQAHAAAVARHKTALKTLKYHPKYRRDGT